jgi:hypothetical protein
MTISSEAIAVVGGATGLAGGGATVGEVDAAITAAIAALTIPDTIDDLDDFSGTPATGDLLQYDGTDWVPYTPEAITVPYSAQFIIDGGGIEIADGIAGDIRIPVASTITSWHLLADQSGSIQIDIWKDTYNNYPPTDADSITAAAPLTISLTTKNTNSTLTGWTTSVTAGDILRFNVDSCTTIERVTIVLYLDREVGP